jgi:hypothetical protein
MKVIDLINRCLCCDDTLPRKIIYKGKEFALKTNNPFPHFYDTDKGVNFMSVIEYFQDLEEDLEIVEVLEEEKEIEELEVEKLLQTKKWKRDKKAWNKINELVRELNELKKGK